jgi:selenoprotein W-related protein
MVGFSHDHELVIEYCAPCNYLDRASGLAVEILSCWGPIIKEVVLLPTAWGVFEVTLDNELIFSKWALGRHALPGELRSLISKRIGPELAEWVDHGPEKTNDAGFSLYAKMPAV